MRLSSIDKAILKVDKIMQQANGVFTTRFTSITDTLSGKIITCGPNEHKSNKFYQCIYSLEGHPGRSDTKVLPGVKSVFRGGGAGPVDDGEFDVVKKRRMMDDAQDDQEDTSCEEALILFEEFERHWSAFRRTRTRSAAERWWNSKRTCSREAACTSRGPAVSGA